MLRVLLAFGALVHSVLSSDALQNYQAKALSDVAGWRQFRSLSMLLFSLVALGIVVMVFNKKEKANRINTLKTKQNLNESFSSTYYLLDEIIPN